MPKADRDTVHIILRACSQGKPKDIILAKEGISHEAIGIENKIYIYLTRPL